MIATKHRNQAKAGHPESVSPENSKTTLSFTNGHPDLRLLEGDELSKWDSLVDASPQGSVFCRSWWLRACGGDIRVLGYFHGGKLVAGIPLLLRKRFGMRVSLMPKFTQVWGVVIEPLSGKPPGVRSREMEILNIFAERLAEETIFYQRFHPSQTNWLPFYWKGFRQTTQYTYYLDGLDRLDQVWAEMSQNARTKIRKAEKCGLTASTCGIDAVFETAVKIFARQHKATPFTREDLQRRYSLAKENNAGECFAAVDPEGKARATTFVVWDQKRAYNLAGGPDPDFRADGAQAFLTWQVIQFAASRSRVFDFAGSMLEQVESSVRAFGAKQDPYNQILKCPFPLRVALDLLGKM